MISRDYQVIDNGIELYPNSKYESEIIDLETYVQLGIYLKFDLDNIPSKPLLIRIYLSPEQVKTNIQNKVFYIFPEKMSGIYLYKEIPVTTGRYVWFDIINTDDNVKYNLVEIGLQRVSY